MQNIGWEISTGGGVSGEHKGLEGGCMSAKVKDEWK